MPINMEDDAPTLGRGLRGAGYIKKDLRERDGNPIKYHSRRGFYSSLAYKRIGTKFVHLPKLNEGLLKVVYPNRSNVGPQRNISADLTKLIKSLLFDGNIDQPLYDSMSMNDKRVFHELLRITHTQHSLRDPIKDPRDVSKQRNDNPSILRELKQVLVDMYSAKLISDKEFKEVLLAIV
ncbi:Hypothetical protein PHPALM_5659 [Phytophthora palmivora]|uniref:Uncharacterized protein n=1 Tax=Phytophthora palmivora TaxID=4796 RepID=A0A2P4YGU5_9STRA|nr:Hypothetical protein PHPALM_5659 [Phytophthora palmivora]